MFKSTARFVHTDRASGLTRLIFTAAALSSVLVIGAIVFLSFPASTGAQKRNVNLKTDRGARETARAPEAAFTPGDLIVYRVGTGAAALNNSSTAAFLDEYTTAPSQLAPVQSIALPTADAGANQSCTLSGSATSEGLITTSADGRFLMFMCYDAAPGVVGVAASSTTTATGGGPILRVVGRADWTGAIDTSTTTTSFSTGNPRSAASTNGTNIWMTGSNSGVVYTTFGSSGAGTAVSPNPSNLRQAQIFNNELYVTSGSAGSTGINRVGAGLPTTAAATTLTGPVTGASNANPIVITTTDTTGLTDGQIVTVSGISGGTTPNTNANGTYYVDVLSSTTFALYIDKNLTIGRAGNGPNLGTGSPTWAVWTNTTALEVVSGTSSPYGFFMARLGSGPTFNGVDTAYIADDGGTIQKYSFTGTGWAANGTIALGSVRGMVGRVSGSSVTLYVTAAGTTNSSLQSLTDTSGFNQTINGSLVVLATSATNTLFRGVAFAPTAFSAAGVTVAGRVSTADGRGITNAKVTISGGDLVKPITVVTGRRGSFEFSEIPAGKSYLVTVAARRFSFDPASQVIDVSDNVANIAFIAER